MSAALVRRGLELLSADLPDGHDDEKKKKMDPKVMKGSRSKKHRGPHVDHSRTSAKDRSRTSAKDRSRTSAKDRSRTSAKDRRLKSCLEEATRGQKKAQAAVTLQYFLYSDSSTSRDQSAKIIGQNSGRLSRSSAAPPVDKREELSSVFTEDEFQQFQREYFGRTVEQE